MQEDALFDLASRDAALDEGRSMLSDIESKAVLRAFGISGVARMTAVLAAVAVAVVANDLAALRDFDAANARHIERTARLHSGSFAIAQAYNRQNE